MNAVDLFCGAGGFSYGFESTGINILYGVDKNETAIQTYEENHSSEGLIADLQDGLPEQVLARKNDIDIVFGSPPCQGFSDARGSRHLETQSNGLVFEFIKFVEKLQPSVVLFENVTGMTTIDDEFMDAVIEEFATIGYEISYETVRASDFGVPQNRDRVIVGGTATDTNFEFSLPTTDSSKCVSVIEAIGDLPENPDNEHYLPLSELDFNTSYIETLRTDRRTVTHHTAKQPNDDEITQRIVSELQPGEMYRSNRFGDRYRQVWDILSDQFTIVERKVLHFISRHRGRKDYRIKGKTVGPVWVEKIYTELEHSQQKIDNAIERLFDDGWLRTDTVDEKVGYDLNTQSGIRPRYMRLTPDSPANTILTTDFKPREKLHPFADRGLSLREGARLQSFPDEFTFCGSFNEIATQIGNAVPPLLAQKIAQNIIPPKNK